MTNSEIREMYDKGFSLEKIIRDFWSDLKKVYPGSTKREAAETVYRVIYEKVLEESREEAER